MSVPHPSRPSPSPAAPILAASRVARAPKRKLLSLLLDVVDEDILERGQDLGLTRSAATFASDPCIPAAWPGDSLAWQFVATRYDVEVENPARRWRGVAAAWLDERLPYNHPRRNRD